MPLGIKDAIYREIRYGLCGAGGVLSGILLPANIKLDMRNVPSKTRADSDYPWLVFRRVTTSEDNQVNFARERIEIEIIGLRSSAAKGDPLLETIRTALLNSFSGKHRSFGKFDSLGNPDPTGGLPMKCNYLSTVEGFSQEMDEKAHILIFIFTYIRS